MNAEEYLGQILHYDTIIKVNNSQINDMRLKIIPGGAIDYSADKVQTSPEDYFAEKMAEFVDDIKPLEAEIIFCKKQRNKIIKEIKSLSNPVYIDVLNKRYVEGKRLRRIAEEKSYTYSWTRHLHRRALNMFEKEVLKK